MTPLPGWLRRGQETVSTGTRAGGSAPSSAVPTPSSVIPAKAGGSQSVIFQAAALVLSYPDEALLERLDTIESALESTPVADRFAPLLTHLRSGTGERAPAQVRGDDGVPGTGSDPGDPGDPRGTGSGLSVLQSFHIQEFDLSRRHALHLTYWTDGDTRRRGEVLAEIKGVYRESGLVVDTGGELPDYLPMVLEFAVADPARGFALLERFRASLELLRLGLVKDRLPHGGVLEAICRCLPGESPKTHAEVQARYGEARPVEFVGLESVDGPHRRPGVPGSQPRDGADLLVTSPRGGN